MFINTSALSASNAAICSSFPRRRESSGVRYHLVSRLRGNDVELGSRLRGNDVGLGSAADGGVSVLERKVFLMTMPARPPDLLTDDFLHIACRPKDSLFEPVEIVLKGKEGKLPGGRAFADIDGHARTEFRTRWYLDPRGRTYRTYALQSTAMDCDLELDESVIAAATPYPTEAKPVFFGHYWLSDQHPTMLADNVACLDFSVAKGGFLCAYRWHGERKLNNDHFVGSVKNASAKSDVSGQRS